MLLSSSYLFHIQNRTVAGAGTNSRRKSIDRHSSPEENKTQLAREVPPQRRQSQSRKIPIEPSSNMPKVPN